MRRGNTLVKTMTNSMLKKDGNDGDEEKDKEAKAKKIPKENYAYFVKDNPHAKPRRVNKQEFDDPKYRGSRSRTELNSGGNPVAPMSGGAQISEKEYEDTRKPVNMSAIEAKKKAMAEQNKKLLEERKAKKNPY